MTKAFAEFSGILGRSEAVRVPKTAELVAKQIRDAIIRGELKDGDSLPAESQVIAQFDVSRPTIREAVRILESEGLVTVSRGARGGARINAPSYAMVARVAGITLQTQNVTIGDLYEMRTLIEPPAARLVAERNSEAAVPILRKHIEAEIAAVDERPLQAHLIVEFHNLMIELAGNKTLLMVAQAVRGLVDAHLQLAQRHLPPASNDESRKAYLHGIRSHSRLVDLIEAKDGPGAEAHWRSHMIVASKTWLGRVGPNTIMDLIG
jgi:DNA-binding FadR family transcriptional regulator